VSVAEEPQDFVIRREHWKFRCGGHVTPVRRAARPLLHQVVVRFAPGTAAVAAEKFLPPAAQHDVEAVAALHIFNTSSRNS
jgi:hypothetical protein